MLAPHSQVELMAPAGDFAALSAALRAGANAIYFGIGQLNMRANAANNFSYEDLPKIVAYCQKANAKSYLTLNTLIYENELKDAKQICTLAKSAGVSAIIASDPSVIMYAHEIGLPIHMSVQANVANIEAVRFWAKYAEVMVLARELSLDQIKTITQSIRDENICGPQGELVGIEVFAHGALCVAVSGKCYMSLALNGENTSANRGKCQQPCRRHYRVTDNDTEDQLVIDERYVMSPKDICTIEVLDQILDAGVRVLKLEGRGRSPDYVGTITQTYRSAIDAWESGQFKKVRDEEQWMKTLEKVFNRGFWMGGYYLGHKLGEWCDVPGSKATEYKEHCGDVTRYFPKLSVVEIYIRACPLRVGDEVWIIGKTTGAVRLTLDELRVGDDGIPTREAKAGELVTFKVPCKVRPKDILYVIRQRENA